MPTPIWAAALSVTAIIVAAVVGARWQRRIARETLTFNTLQEQMWDSDYINARKIFIRVRDSKSAQELAALANLSNATEEQAQEAASIRSIINNYEIASLGINMGVLDEEFYNRFFRGTFVKDYEGIKPFIDAVKSRNSKAYIEYSAIYEKWRDK